MRNDKYSKCWCISNKKKYTPFYYPRNAHKFVRIQKDFQRNQNIQLIVGQIQNWTDFVVNSISTYWPCASLFTTHLCSVNWKAQNLFDGFFFYDQTLAVSLWYDCQLLCACIFACTVLSQCTVLLSLRFTCNSMAWTQNDLFRKP